MSYQRQAYQYCIHLMGRLKKVLSLDAKRQFVRVKNIVKTHASKLEPKITRKLKLLWSKILIFFHHYYPQVIVIYRQILKKLTFLLKKLKLTLTWQLKNFHPLKNPYWTASLLSTAFIISVSATVWMFIPSNFTGSSQVQLDVQNSDNFNQPQNSDNESQTESDHLTSEDSQKETENNGEQELESNSNGDQQAATDSGEIVKSNASASGTALRPTPSPQPQAKTPSSSSKNNLAVSLPHSDLVERDPEPQPPQMIVTYPDYGGTEEIIEGEKICIVDELLGGYPENVNRISWVNGQAYPEFAYLQPLCFDPTIGHNTVAVQYKNTSSGDVSHKHELSFSVVRKQAEVNPQVESETETEVATSAGDVEVVSE